MQLLSAVKIENPENLANFEKEVETKLGRSNVMGTREYLLDKAKKEGIALGIAQTKQLLKAEREKIKEVKAKEAEKTRAIALELKKMRIEIMDIAKATGLSVAEVEKL